MSKLNNIEIPTGPTLILIGVLGILSSFLSSLLANDEGILPWLVDLAANFQMLYLLSLIIGLILTLEKNRGYLWVIIFIPVPWLTAHDSATETTSTDQSIKVLSANTNFKNSDLQALKELINSEQPDIVVLLELSHGQARQLADLKDYPFQQINPDDSPFGIGLLSKLPFSSVTVDFNWRGSSLKIPTIKIVAEWNAQLINVVAFHPMPPIAPEFHLARNKKIQEIVEKSKQSGLPTIIAGDFNATPWSSAFAPIEYMRATGLQSTWPTRYFGLSVDHVLVSDHWQVKQSRVGPDIGSDHLPVVAEVINPDGSDMSQLQ